MTTQASTASRSSRGRLGVSPDERASARAARRGGPPSRCGRAPRRPRAPTGFAGRARARAATPRAGPRRPPPRAARWREHEQRRAERAPQRGVEPEPAAEGEDERAAGEDGGERGPGAERPGSGAATRATPRRATRAMAARNAHSVLPSSNAKATAALRATARGSNRPRWSGIVRLPRPIPVHLGWAPPHCRRSSPSHARSPRRYTSTCTVLAKAAHAEQATSVSTTASAVPTSMPTRRPIAS